MPNTATIQQDALAYALADMIWKAGNGQTAIICLPQPNIVHVTSSPQFNEDGLTEKVMHNLVIFYIRHQRTELTKMFCQLQLCLMNKFDELHQTLRRNIHVVSRLLLVISTL